MKRWKVKCAYDGTDFQGWQSQVSNNAIQDVIETRLEEIFKTPVRIHGSGRTDAGVHAKGQVFHFDADWEHSPKKLHTALKLKIPPSIQIVTLVKASRDFHARFSAKGKRYAYQLFLGYAPPTETRYYWSLGERDLDIDAMQRAAKYLLGKHDFSAFAAATRRGETQGSPVKEIWRLDITKKGPRIRIVTEGSGYLYKMVRSIVGALVDVGIGKLTPSQVKEILSSKKRTRTVVTAPPQGLFLEKVDY